jgi:hypothetical protein
MKYSSATVLAFIVLSGLASACTQTRTMTLEAAPANLFDPTAPIRVIGSYGVPGRHGYVVSGAGEGLGVGMGQGALVSVGGGASSGQPMGLALGILLAPFFAVGGGIYGAAAAHPADETEQAITAIELVYDDDDLLGSLSDLISERIQELGFPVETPCEGLNGRSVVEGDTASSGEALFRCRDEGVKIRLRITASYVFSTKGTYSPDLQFAIDVVAVTAYADRSRTAEEFHWAYLSPELEFFEATKTEAVLLRHQVADAQQKLADRIVDDLFLMRRSQHITGTYYPDRKGENFIPQRITPDTVNRVPTQTQLIIPQKALSE